MNKTPDCDRCINNAHSSYLVCAIHPEGKSPCPDFEDDGSTEELWCPDGYTFVNDKLVKLSLNKRLDADTRCDRNMDQIP